ncbi:putative hydrocephalus inducing, partial [Operophtera brumata]
MDIELMKLRIIKKVAPMIDTGFDSEFPWIGKFPKISKRYRTNINDVLQLIPHRGLLKPGEIQYVHVIFNPKTNINIKAILDCEVLGGPAESIIVTGQSSDLMYKLNSQRINFKIRSFHESASEKLLMSNIAQLPYEYKTYLDEPKFKNELEGTILDLIPPDKILEPEEEAELNIVMRPGIVGYFNRVFLLEIGHLPHIPIELFGWGVIPQVYFSLQRPEIAYLHPEIGYQAIADLTQEYLEAVSEIFSKNGSEHLDSSLTEQCFVDPDFKLGWHICSPSRMLLINHVKQRPEILNAYSTSLKMGPIPGFHTTPYVIDYGVVITDSTVQCTAEIINYGPIATKLHFAKATHVPTWLSIKLCGKLNPGETGKLDVVFSPTSIDFTELEQNVETSFNLEASFIFLVFSTSSSACRSALAA